MRFSPSRVALAYIALSVLALALFAIPLWYGFRANLGTFRAYVPGEEMQRLVDVFHREGAQAVAAAMDSYVGSMPRDQVVLFADPSKLRLAGNLPAWPGEVPDADGTYGLVIGLGGGASMRVVTSQMTLPGGYRLLMGRESVRFEALIERFWYGIAGATAIVLALGAAFAWLLRRALLSEVDEISRTASAIVQGDLSRRLPARGGSAELDTLAQTVNGMLEQLARAQRRSEDSLAEAQRLSHTGSFSWRPATGEVSWSEETYRILEYTTDTRPSLDLARRRVHPDDLASCEEAARRVPREQGEFEFEHRLLMPRGEVKHLRVVGHAAKDESGKLVEVQGAVMDVTAQRLAQRDLEIALQDVKASEAELRRIIDAIPTQVWCALPDGSTEFQNQRWLDYSGLTADQGRGWGWRDSVHPDDVEAYTARWLAIHASRAPGESEARFRRFDGEYRWFLSRVAPVPDEQGNVAKWYGANTDIEDRKRAEEALRRQKAHLDELFDLAPDAVVLTELYPPRIVRVNREFTRMFGYTSEEAVGLSLRDLIAPGELQPDYAKNAGAIASGQKIDMEVVRQRKDGTRLHAHFTAAAIKTGDGKGAAYLVYRDITERKRVEEELRSRQQLLDLARKAARAVPFEWRVGHENRWSPELEEMHGLAPGSFDGTLQGWKKLFHPQDWPAVNGAVEESLRTGNGATEYRAILPDGSVRWLQATGSTICDDEGKPVRLVGFVQDVTQRRNAEDEVRTMERKLRQAQRLEAMGTLAGGIAHDFNNILGAILGFGEMALRDASKGSRLRRDLDSVMTAGERGRALVERILAFSRSGVGERVPVHVEKVVREALDLLEAKLPEGIRVEARLEAGRAAMLGDPTQVHQVLMNLGMNAMQAMGSGGTLSVTLDAVHIDAARAATIGTLAAADYVVLSVRDTGSGIAPEIVERIFDPFFSTKDVSAGTGLGLSLVHGIVTEVGGAIDVASTPQAGSAFTVYLPRAGDATESPEDAEPAMPRGNRERVLVVDDEEPLVRLATRTLEELSYLPVGFTSSLAALDAFRADPGNFDAVITDERMPGLSGSALIREVRLLRSSIPIVLMSGYTGGIVQSRALESGADEVLQKPLKARELATSLARVLRP